MLFTRHPANPIIPRTPGTFHSVHVANPDVLLWRGKYTLYFRGQDERGHDEIGVAWAHPDAFDGVHWQFYPGNPILRVGPSKFDAAHVLDPAAVAVDDRVYLYYTAHSTDATRPSGPGLATSLDGIHFEKAITNPVATGIAPEVVYHEGRFYLFYTRPTYGGGQAWYVCSSQDGVHFYPWDERIALRPSTQQGSFDSYSVVTPRIMWDSPYYYAIYSGSDRFVDYPRAFGLARSRDLYHWERYPDNPIMLRGEPGAWDEGAMWFGTTMRVGDTYYLWYEGCGGGGTLSQEADYGGYAQTSFSQIGLATCPAPFPDW